MSSGAGTAAWCFTARADGDFAIDAPGVDQARAELLRGLRGPDVAWNWLHQVHGAGVVEATAPGQHHGTDADALVTAVAMVPIAVQTADCGAVVLTSPEGVLGVAHAGWRGLRAGVVQATVGAMRDLGATSVDAHIGPMIHPGCYQFGADDLATVAATLGPAVVGRTSAGAPALDVPAAVESALVDAGVTLVDRSPGCTACGADRWYSHRARREAGRMTAVAWMGDPT